MLQRIQSLFLLGVVIISLLLLFIPVYETFQVINGTESERIPVLISKSNVLKLLNAATGILCFLAIFLYKRRNIQVRMSNLAILVTCILVALLFFMADTEGQQIHYLTGSYLPLVQVLFAFLASWFIKKDEALVKSADRLR